MKLFKRRQTAAQALDALSILDAAKMTPQELADALGNGENGLTEDAVLLKQEIYGKNVVRTGNESTPLKRLAASLFNPFNIVLMVIALITFITDVVVSSTDDYSTVIIILILIGVSSAVSFIQSERANSAAQKLTAMVENTVLVVRGGRAKEVPTKEVVPGDIIRLSGGNIIPCDVRFLSAKDAFVSQSALTGESLPVEKFASEPPSNEDTKDALGLKSVGFMGTNMVSGSVTAMAVNCGNDTVFGKLAAATVRSGKNSFEKGIHSVSKLLLRLMAITVPLVFVFNWIIKGDFTTSLLFAVTVAVGLTPEMLPVILTTTLSRGALTMSRLKTIVKNQSAIQAFGEIDVLCTDKTGTLTEDKIVLEKYMDIQGNDDKRVLRHAYLNSYFQTGLKNLIDVAVISRGEQYGFSDLLKGYKVIDEIPFDFTRRRMSVIIEDAGGKRQLITKGAAEEMLEVCTHADFGGLVVKLEGEVLEKAMEVIARHNSDGLRILAVAQKNFLGEKGQFSVSDERELVLLGFVGFLDPPKESAKASIAALESIGVRVVVLTGDNLGVAAKVCEKVGISTDIYLVGQDVEGMDDQALLGAARTCNLFAKLNPLQKKRIIKALQDGGHTVGFLGDGINDAPALSHADVGISVDSGADIAKESADIILLEKDLMVLERGVLEGRKTFGNIIKYIKMAVSGNFGNILSILAASIFLPFFPLLPVHIMVQNLFCDFSQLGIPFDNVDVRYKQRPRRWNTKGLVRFTLIFGALSSVFDIACFAVLWYLLGANSVENAALFHAGWFVFGTVSQIIIVHIIRTEQLPFVGSRASKPLAASGILVILLALLVGFTPVAVMFDMAVLPLKYLAYLAVLLAAYAVSAEVMKRRYIKDFGGLL